MVLPAEPEPIWIHAADYCANSAASLRDDPNLPLQNIVLGTKAAPVSDRVTRSLRNTLLYDGISTKTINDSDQNAYEVTLLPADFGGYCITGYRSIDVSKHSSVRLPYRVIRQDIDEHAIGYPNFEFEHNLRPLLKRVSAQNEESVTPVTIRYKD